MKKNQDQPTDAAELRRRAEKRLKEKPTATGQPLTEADLRRLLQELQVHQIELEMQNEELQQAHMEIEAGVGKYTDLYEFSPRGTLPREGTCPLIVRIEAVVTKDGQECRAALADVTERHQAAVERDRLIQELQQALAKVKMLSGFLPICMSCKKIRDDKGYWAQVEVYIRDNSEAEFI